LDSLFLRGRFRLAAVAIALGAPLALQAAPADDVKSLMEGGKPAEAYALGKQNPDALGDPAFDFFFGVAAIESGHAGEGVLALERYLLQYPDNVSARLQLARGYFALNEDARAREEFEALRKLDPPAPVVATIDRYLDAVRLRETRYNTSTGLYIEAGIGHDSNVNSGVASANISLQNLGPVVVGPGGMKIADTYTTLGAGGYLSHPVAPGVALFANGFGELKSNQKDANGQYDLGNYAIGGGVSVLREKNLYRLGVNDGLITLGGDRYRTSVGGSIEWQRQLDELQSVSVGGQYARLTYTGTNSPRNAEFTGLSAGYRRLFAHAWQPTLALSANAGEEQTLDSTRNDLGRRLYGGRAGVNFTPGAKWGVSVGYSFQKSTYQAPDVLLGATRRDRYEAFDAAVSYLYSRNVSFRGELMLAKNNSNIELFSFPRDTVAFKVRYEFK
jgi:hypothetical protein